jgi:hypothetical protein
MPLYWLPISIRLLVSAPSPWKSFFLFGKQGVPRQVQPLLEQLFPSPAGWKGGQASNEDLFPLGYGERERAG